MKTARFATICPGCSKRIEPGDMIESIGVAFNCEACVREFWQANASAPHPVITGYPPSSQYEPGRP